MLRRGETLPTLAHSVTWQPLSTYSASELRDRGFCYPRMAGTASTASVRNEQLTLAQRFDALAGQRGEGR